MIKAVLEKRRKIAAATYALKNAKRQNMADGGTMGTQPKNREAASGLTKGGGSVVPANARGTQDYKDLSVNPAAAASPAQQQPPANLRQAAAAAAAKPVKQAPPAAANPAKQAPPAATKPVKQASTMGGLMSQQDANLMARAKAGGGQLLSKTFPSGRDRLNYLTARARMEK